MSRQELAEAVNAYQWRTHRVEDRMDENDIGKLERGDHRWPSARRREALRSVLHAATDADLGFYIIRGMATGTERSLVTALSESEPAPVTDLDDPRGASARPYPSVSAEGQRFRSGFRSPQEDTADWDEIESFDLWELHEVLHQPRISGQDLRLVEVGCTRLDQHYAELSSAAVLPRVSLLLRRIVSLLRQARTATDRRRLCSVTGRLAGLRGWILFDQARYPSADAWYASAIQAASEAQDATLYGWLLGAQSLIPSYQHDHNSALALIKAGQATANTGADATVRAWLFALEARAQAGIGEYPSFRDARQAAEHLVATTEPEERRHGMDFVDGRLDTTYYAGTSLLLLHQPTPATDFLHHSLATLPTSHAKAHAILLLSLATAAGQEDDPDRAAELTKQALAAASSQPIMPILQRARDVRRQITAEAHSVSAFTELDERLDEFAASLGTSNRGIAS